MPCMTALYRVLACRNADHPSKAHPCNAGLCVHVRASMRRLARQVLTRNPRGYAHVKVAHRLQDKSLQEAHLLALVSAVSSRHVQRPGLSGRCKPLLCTGTGCCCCCRWCCCCCCCCSHGERLDWESGVLLVASAGQQRTVSQAVACGCTVADAAPQDALIAVQDPRKFTERPVSVFCTLVSTQSAKIKLRLDLINMGLPGGGGVFCHKVWPFCCGGVS